MMEFLRALAPRRDGDASLAVAVVPSRFETERPMTALPIVAHTIGSDPTIESGVLPVVDPSAWHVERRAERRHEAPMPGAPIVVTRPVSEAQREREPADDNPRAAPRESRSNDTSGPLRPIRPSPADVRHPLAGLGRQQPPGREPQGQATATVAPVPATSATTVPLARSLTTVVAMPSATAARAPMSPAFLAARVTPPADRPPVIEVTIDRLEVRAPAPVEPAPPIRRRAASPSLPLADYLRGKTGQSGGAA